MDTKKPLLVNTIPFDISPNILTESITADGKVQLSGVLQRTKQKNQNGRVYPDHVLKREVDKYQQLIVERRALGELDHSADSVINLKNVSHNVVECHFDGTDVIGTIELLTTPCGNIARELIRNGIKLGISSRGLGSVRRISEGTVEVQDDFELVCFDLVSNPSTRGAFMLPLTESVLTEGLTTLQPSEFDKYMKIENLIRDILTEIR